MKMKNIVRRTVTLGLAAVLTVTSIQVPAYAADTGIAAGFAASDIFLTEDLSQELSADLSAPDEDISVDGLLGEMTKDDIPVDEVLTDETDGAEDELVPETEEVSPVEEIISETAEETDTVSENELLIDTVSDDTLLPETDGGESWIGTGTENSPWEISSLSDLTVLRDRVNAGKSYNGKYFIMTNDIVLTSDNWEPIGNHNYITDQNFVYAAYYDFAGHFNGNGHKITGLKITGSGNYKGLFGRVTGTLYRLTVEGSVSGGSYVGGIAGSDAGTIELCEFNGSVTGSGENTGGITGCLEHSSEYVVGASNTRIENCMSRASVSGSKNTGGIAGSKDGTIKNCTHIGNITGSGENTGGIAGLDQAGLIEGCLNSGEETVDSQTQTYSINGGKNTGGIAGNSTGAIENCTNAAAIAADKEYIGGIAGRAGISIRGCRNTGNVSSGPNNYTGGIVGHISKNDDNTTYIVNEFGVFSCTNEGSINGKVNTGGIAGKAETCAVTDCVNNGKVNSNGNQRCGGIVGEAVSAVSISDCTNNGEVNGRENLGGIAGDAYGDFAITNCVNSGNLIRTQNKEGYNQGGIAGRTRNKCKVTDCTNLGDVGGHLKSGGIVGSVESAGDIDNCINTGKVTGLSYVGGIEGDRGGSGTTRNCTNKGEITAVKACAGGITGKSDGNIESCINEGDVTGDYWEIGGIAGSGNNLGINSCTNKGKVKTPGWGAGGILGIGEKGGINNCRNIGEVTLTGDPNPDIDQNWYDTEQYGRYIGGIAGDSTDLNISCCLNTGKVIGGYEVGGITGNAQNTNITLCFNKAEIQANGKFTNNETHVGGIAGRVHTGIISKCANKGNVSALTGSCAGGITGKLEGSEGKANKKERTINANSVGDAEVSNCYNRGYIKGTDYVGGLVGLLHFWQRVRTCYNFSTEPYSESGRNVGKLVGEYYGYPFDSIIPGVKETHYEGAYNTVREIVGVYQCCFTDNSLLPVGYDPLNLFGGYRYFTNEQMKDKTLFDEKFSETNEYGDSLYNTWVFFEGKEGHSHLIYDNPDDPDDISPPRFIWDPGWNNGGAWDMGKDAPIIHNEDWNKMPGAGGKGGVGGRGGNGGRGVSLVIIDNEDSFRQFRDDVNNGKSYEGIEVRLDKDLVLSDTSWTPIGEYHFKSSDNQIELEHPFNGIFNGNGHNMILYVVECSGNGDCAGLFGYIGEKGEVRNLRVNLYPRNGGRGKLTAGKKYVGGIAGFSRGRIENCEFSGDVENTNSGSDSLTGGIVGRNGIDSVYEGSFYARIANCLHTGTVTGSGISGGITGIINRGIAENCIHCRGDVTGNTAGGIIGELRNDEDIRY